MWNISWLISTDLKKKKRNCINSFSISFPASEQQDKALGVGISPPPIHTSLMPQSLQSVFALWFYALIPWGVFGFLHDVYDVFLVCTVRFPRTAKPRTASQLLIGNQFPSAFQPASPNSDSGLENWHQEQMAQDRQETECNFYLTNNPPETGWDEEERRTFLRLYHRRGGTFGVKRAAFLSRSPWILYVFLKETAGKQQSWRLSTSFAELVFLFT